MYVREQRTIRFLLFPFERSTRFSRLDPLRGQLDGSSDGSFGELRQIESGSASDIAVSQIIPKRV